MTLVWIGLVVVVLLALMLVHDRREKVRGARLNPEAGARSGIRGTNGTGNPDAYRGSSGTTGWGGASV